MSGLDSLKDVVTESNTIIDSAIEFIGGLHQKLVEALAKDGLDEDSAVGELADELKAKDQELAQAIVANTDATPGTPPTQSGTAAGTTGTDPATGTTQPQS